MVKDGMPVSVPTSAAATPQPARKRLWSMPVAEETVVAASTSGPSHPQLEQANLLTTKRSRSDPAEPTEEEEESKSVKVTATTDLNANISDSGNTGGGSTLPAAIAESMVHVSSSNESSALPRCPPHYDAEVWDALPQDLQREILRETAPSQAGAYFFGPKTLPEFYLVLFRKRSPPPPVLRTYFMDPSSVFTIFFSLNPYFPRKCRRPIPPSSLLRCPIFQNRRPLFFRFRHRLRLETRRPHALRPGGVPARRLNLPSHATASRKHQRRRM
jgi:hypothetical protein